MKITNEDYKLLKQAIEPLMNEAVEKHYVDNNLSSMRMRWDVLYASKVKIGDDVGIQGDINLYAYMNDTHIDTALRTIFKELGSAHGSKLNN